MRIPDRHIRRVIKPAVFLLALAPLAWLVWRLASDDLGANPVETLNRYTGDWTLRFLLVTLALSPLRRLSGWHGLMRLRRMLGLYAFFYACMRFPGRGSSSIAMSRPSSRTWPSARSSPSVSPHSCF